MMSRSLLCPQCLARFWAHSGCPQNVCWMNEWRGQKESRYVTGRAQAGEPCATTHINSSTSPAHHQPLACASEISLSEDPPIGFCFPFSPSLAWVTPVLRTVGGGDLWHWYRVTGMKLKQLLKTNCMQPPAIPIPLSQWEPALLVPASAPFSPGCRMLWKQGFSGQEEEQDRIDLHNRASPKIYYVASLGNSAC